MADEKSPEAQERELDAAVTKKAQEFDEEVADLPNGEARRFLLAAMAKSVGHQVVLLDVDPTAIGDIIRRGMQEGQRLVLQRATEKYGKGN